MKSLKRLLACALAILTLVAVFTGCNSTGGSNSSNSNTDTSQSSAALTSDTSAPPSVTSNDGTTEVEQPSTADAAITVGSMDIVTGQFAAGGTSNTPAAIGVELVFEPLFEVDTTTGEMKSRIVKSFEWEDDVTLRITLKDGIYFSDGTQMTAEDVFYSLQRYASSMIGDYYRVIDYDESYALEDDPLTFYLIYFEPFGPGIRLLDIQVMSKAWCEAHPDEGAPEWFNDPCGSGPYAVTEVVDGSYIKLALRDDYWDGANQFEVKEITVRKYSDSTAMFVDFQNGVIDIILGLSSTDIDSMNSGAVPGATLVTQSMNDVGMLCMNESNTYLQNIKVREAIAYALDMDAISAIGFGNLKAEATSHLASTLSMYVPQEVYKYDPQYAKQCLEEAGYSMGEVSLLFVCDSNVSNVRIAEAVQGYLGDVGINLEVQSLDMAATIQLYLSGGSDFFLFYVTGGNIQREPLQAFSTLESTAPFPLSRISDVTLQDYLHAGKTTIDEGGRAEAYQAVDVWLYENFHALPVCEFLEAYAYNSRIESMSISSTTRAKLLDIKLVK